MCILLLGTTRHDLITLCGNEYVKKPRRAIASFLIITLCWATLIVANTSKYSSEERSVASVGLTEDSWRVGR
jgi:hypothetical protein